jgi:hypothetical protein
MKWPWRQFAQRHSDWAPSLMFSDFLDFCNDFDTVEMKRKNACKSETSSA